MYKPKYEEKLIHMFILLDDFCNAFHTWQEGRQMGESTKKVGRPSKLAASEVLAILIYYHYSGYKHSMPDVLPTIISIWYLKGYYAVIFPKQ